MKHFYFQLDKTEKEESKQLFQLWFEQRESWSRYCFIASYRPECFQKSSWKPSHTSLLSLLEVAYTDKAWEEEKKLQQKCCGCSLDVNQQNNGLGKKYANGIFIWKVKSWHISVFQSIWRCICFICFGYGCPLLGH